MLAVMGAEAFVERARRELLATGEIVHERTTMQVSALSAGEAHITRLAADGTTNPGSPPSCTCPFGSRTGTMVRSVKRPPLFRTGCGFAVRGAASQVRATNA
jgi:hypothetical protein